MKPDRQTCDLCGLPCPSSSADESADGPRYHFCCHGCRQVFTILMEAADDPDPSSFQQTELFRKCRQMGIISAATEATDRGRAGEREKPLLAATADTADAVDGFQSTAESGLLDTTFNLSGMWCPACAWLVEETLRRADGIAHARCNFATDRLRVTYDPVRMPTDRIAARLEDLGYGAALPDEAEGPETKREFIRFAISAFLTANVMMLSWALYTGFFSDISAETIRNLSWPIFFLATAVMFYGGRRIYLKAWQGLFSATFGMETLVSAGAFSAYLYSTTQLLAGRLHLYFDTATMLITLVLLGKTLESRARDKVKAGLQNFFSLQPAKVKICSPGFPRGRYAAIGQLKPGDLFEIAAGEIVPADGRVVSGRAGISEASLTGEPAPIVRTTGDSVRAGTEVVDGTLRATATAVGAASTLGQMMDIMTRALDEKTPFEGRTDRLLQGFVPAILGLALLTGAVSRLTGLATEAAVMRALTVMVISCPCALGIAVPLARVAGISLAGKHGILIRAFSCFEQAPKVDAVVFDKTGTITDGRWALRRIVPAAPLDADEALRLAAALEKNARHPIAAELLRRAGQKGLALPQVNDLKTFENGLSGTVGGHQIKIGSKIFLAEPPTRMAAPALGDLSAPSALDSVVYMSRNGLICAAFVFGDRIKATARRAINRLHQRGCRTYLVSGDEARAVGAVADAVGIPAAGGDMLPRDKARFIRNLIGEGRKTIMVGDGINDAPALAQADISMAVYSAAGLAGEIADLTLMRGDPEQVIDFLDLARHVNRTILTNLSFSFVYNAISIPAAMLGLLHPLVAVCAMLLSSLTVIGNTLLLIRKNQNFS